MRSSVGRARRTGTIGAATPLESRRRVDQRLLTATDVPVFVVDRAAGSSAYLIACDHAGRAIPRALADLHLSGDTLSTHVAWDLGAAALARRLSARLDACAILQSYSRLVIDANRPPHAPDSIPTLSERTHIMANEELAAHDVDARIEEIFRPYHQRIHDALDARGARPTALVALHSFTPVYMDERRPWHVGVLYGRDARLGRLLLDGLRRDATLVVGDNEPYAVSDATDYTILTHGEQRRIPHVEIEVRQDLLATDAGVDTWAERLGRALEDAAPRLFPGGCVT